MEMGDQTWDQIVERLREDKALVAESAAREQSRPDIAYNDDDKGLNGENQYLE